MSVVLARLEADGPHQNHKQGQFMRSRVSWEAQV